MPLPTPQDAAYGRANAGPFQAIGSTFLRNAPYVSPIYNLVNSAAHVIQGTTGQFGPSPPTPFNWFARLFSGNPTNAPRATAVYPDQSQSTDQGYFSQGTGFTPAPQAGQPNANLPGVFQQPPQQNPSDALRQLFNTGRAPNAPAFSQTLPQFMFPGSAIGPLGGGNTNPYTPNMRNPFSEDNSIPGMAAANLSYIMSRNQP